MFRRSLAAVALCSAALSAGAGLAQPTPIVRVERRQAVRTAQRSAASRGSWFRHSYLSHGPTAAQVQRAAKKARNVRRHKPHGRGCA